MGTGIPMMGRKLHRNPDWGRDKEGNIFTLHFKIMLEEIGKNVLNKQYQ